MDAKLNTQNRVSLTRGINVPDFTKGRDAAYAAQREGIEDLAKAYSNVGAAVQYSGRVLYEYDQHNVAKQYAADEAILKTKYAEQYAALSDRISKQSFGSSAEMKAAFDAGAQEIDERIADGLENGFNNADGTVFRFRNADRFEEPLRQLGEVQRATAMNTAVDSWIVEEDNRTQQAFDTQMSMAVLLSDNDGVQKVYEQMCAFYPARKELYAAKRDYALASIANKKAGAVRDNSLKLQKDECEMQLSAAIAANDPVRADAVLSRMIKLGLRTEGYKEAYLEKEGLVVAKAVEKEAGKIKRDLASAKARYDKAEEAYNKEVARLDEADARAVIELGKATNDPKKYREGMDALAKSKGWKQETADTYVAAFEAKVQAKRDMELQEEAEAFDANVKKLDNRLAKAITKFAEQTKDAETFREGLDIYVKNGEMSEAEATVLTATFEKKLQAEQEEEAKKAREAFDAHLKDLDVGLAGAIKKLAETSGDAETFREGLDILVKNEKISEAEATVLTADFEMRKKAGRAKAAYTSKKVELDLAMANATATGDLGRVRQVAYDRMLFLGESEELAQLRVEKAEIAIANEKARIASKQLAEEKAAQAKGEKERARAEKAKARKEAKLVAEQAKRDKRGRDVDEEIAKKTNDRDLYSDVLRRRVEAGEINEDDAARFDNLFNLNIAQKELVAQGRFLKKDARARFNLNFDTAKELGDEELAREACKMAVDFGLMSQETADAQLLNFRVENHAAIRNAKAKTANTIAGAMTRKLEVDLRRTMNSEVRQRFTGGDSAKERALVGIEESADDMKYNKERARAEFYKSYDESAAEAMRAYEEELAGIPNLSADDKNKNTLAHQEMLERVKKSTWAQFETQLDAQALENSVRFKNGMVEMKYNKASISQYSADPVYKNISLDDTNADEEYKFARDAERATPAQKQAVLAAYIVIGKEDPDAPDFQQKVHRALSELRLSGNGVQRGDYENVVAFATNLMEGKGKHKMGANEARVYLDHVSVKLGEYFDVSAKKRSTVADAWRHINDSEMSGDACDKVNNLIFQLPDLVNDLPTAMAIFDKAVAQIYVEDEEEKANARADDVLNWHASLSSRGK